MINILSHILIIAYYILSMCQSIPFIVKILRTKSSNDFSLLNRLLQYTALLCFTIYLTLGTDPIIIKIIGYVDLAVLTLENILILKYYKRKESAPHHEQQN